MAHLSQGVRLKSDSKIVELRAHGGWLSLVNTEVCYLCLRGHVGIAGADGGDIGVYVLEPACRWMAIVIVCSLCL